MFTVIGVVLGYTFNIFLKVLIATGKRVFYIYYNLAFYEVASKVESIVMSSFTLILIGLAFAYVNGTYEVKTLSF